MALARSASGPGGLSINTGAANLFGSSTSQPAASGGLFGSAAPASSAATAPSLFGAAQPAKPTTSLFGASTTTTQPQQSTGLFGGTAAASTSQPQQTGGLFGSATGGAASQPAKTGGLFGLGSTAPAQPAQTGGLFGATAQTQQPQTGGGLFGASTTTQQPQMGGGLFGSSTTTQPQQQATGGMFGQASTAAKPSLFGQPAQQQQPAAGGSLFGGAPAGKSLLGGSTSALGGGLTMGQGAQQQQQVVPGVRIDLSNLKSTTRFNDLQEDIQKEIMTLDNFIQTCMNERNQVEAFTPAHEEQLQSVPGDVRFVSRKYDGVANTLSSDAQAIEGLRELVRLDADAARLSFRAADNLKLPTQYHASGLWSSARQQVGNGTNGDSDSGPDLIHYFSRTADEMDEQLRKFQKNLAEIESHMHGVQANIVDQLQRASTARNGSTDDRLAELVGVLEDFEQSILTVAGTVGGAREGVTDLQLGSYMSSRTR